MNLLSANLTRVLASIFLFTLIMGALAITGFDLVTNQAVNPIAISILASAISATLPILGFHAGTTAVNGTVSSAVAASVEANKQSTDAAVRATIKAINGDKTNGS